MIRVLTISTLFPNPAQPRHGLFVERRLRELVRSGEVEAKVIAPVSMWRARGVPRETVRDGLPVAHPRFVTIPGIGGPAHPWTMAASILRHLRWRRPDCDVIDAHYLFPDGAAAAVVARRFRLPYLLTARGSDVNLHAQRGLERRWVRWAVRHAFATIAVSEALRERLLELGADPARCVTLRNGVDLERFRPIDRVAGASPRRDPNHELVLMVGHLTEVKGFDRAIRAIAALEDCELAIVGEGPDRGALEALAARLGVADRVHLLGPLTPEQLPELYSAADVLCMASHREGMPNVVLEALACGTPVAGVAVGGVPEVVNDPVAGALVPTNQPNDLGRALRAVLDAPRDREATRRFGERYSWAATTAGQLELLRAAQGRHAPS